MKTLPLGLGIGLAFVVGACGWVMQARHDSRYPALSLARADGEALTSNSDQSQIAQLAANILVQKHYLRKLPHEEISSRMLHEYLNTLDVRHTYFLASDVAEFEQNRATLEDRMLKTGDTRPAFVIFNRLLKRIDEQNAYIDELLKSEQFDFSSDDTYSLDRKNVPWPSDAAAEKKIWRDTLRYEYLQEKLNKTKPEEIVKLLTKRHARLQKTFKELDRDEIFQFYMNALAHAYDPHSDYFGKTAFETFNMQTTTLALFGIGASLTEEDGYCKIAELIPGGPAEKSKQLKAGDKIVGVAQDGKDLVDVVEMKLDKIVEQIRGPKGTKVRLSIIPAGATDPSLRKTVVLVRDEIKLQDQEAKAKIIDYPIGNGQTTRLGVIDLPSFYAEDPEDNAGKSATADVSRLLKKLEDEKVKGIIFDLRANPGGSLRGVVKMAGLFVKQGPVVQVRDTDGKTEVQRTHPLPVYYGGPMIVLTSRTSASASEIMAGALQDYGRALIVGETSTYGKGTVQSVLPLDEFLRYYNVKLNTPAGALKPTIQKFYRASGSSTQLKGVVPDIILPSLGNVIDIGEKTQDYPMPWDVIPSAQPANMNMVEPYLSDLRRKSEARVSSDKDFAYLKQDIEQYQKLWTSKRVSLNEAKRLQEKEEAAKRTKERRAALAAKPAFQGKIYLVTLRDVDKPGLTLAPPPKPPLKSLNPDDPENLAPAIDETQPQNDTMLTETERILLDYINLRGGTQARK